ncbi:hypothetical protein Tco_0168897 [Tanacetum coccineum]
MANVTSLLTSLCTKINDFGNTNQASSSSTLPSNTIPNPRNEAKAITTRSGVSYEGPSIPMPPPFVNPDVVEETSTDHVPPPLTQKVQETNSQTTTKVNQEGIVNNPKTYELKLPYPERRNVEKRQEKDKIYSGSPTISSDDSFPSSSPVKTSDSTSEEFTDEFTLLTVIRTGDDVSILKELQEDTFSNYSNPAFQIDITFESSNVNPLFEEKDKDIEIKSSTFVTLTSPAASELEDYLEKDSIPPGIDLTLPTTLEVFEEIKEKEDEVSSDVLINTIVMPIRITFDNPIDFNDHFSKPKDLKKDLTVSFNYSDLSILSPPLLDSDSPFTAELSASVTLNSLRNEDKVFKPGILVYHAIHDKNLVTLEENLKENISSGTLLVFKEQSFLLPPLEQPDKCLNFEPILVMKNVVDFYQSNIEDVDSLTLIIWTFLPHFTYSFHKPVAFSMEVSCSKPSEPQLTPSPSHPSEIHVEPQSDPSPRPSPTTHIPDSIPEDSGGNQGGQSSSDRSLSGNEGGMTLQSVYDLCISLCTQVTNQAKEIHHLKSQIKKLKKKAKPVITHHRAWMKSVSLKQRLIGKKSLKKN